MNEFQESLQQELDAENAQENKSIAELMNDSFNLYIKFCEQMQVFCDKQAKGV